MMNVNYKHCEEREREKINTGVIYLVIRIRINESIISQYGKYTTFDPIFRGGGSIQGYASICLTMQSTMVSSYGG